MLLLVVPQAACGAGWQQPSLGDTTPFKPRQQVQVWQQGELLRLHGVVLTTDSVSGIPFLQPLDCEGCRISVPRTTVDSMRVGNPSGGFLKSAGLVLGGMAVMALVLCGTLSRCQYGN